MMRNSARLVVAFGVMLALVLAGCGSGSDDTRDASPTTTDPSSAGGAALSSLAGTWRFSLEAPRLNQGTGSYAGATVSLADNRIIVEGPAYARSETPVGYLFAEHEITCRGDVCYGRGGTTPLPYGFQPSGSAIRLVDPATLQPHTAGAGGQCNLPSVPDAGVLKDFNGRSFSVLTGFSSSGASDCYQVLFTVKASKIST